MLRLIRQEGQQAFKLDITFLFPNNNGLLFINGTYSEFDEFECIMTYLILFFIIHLTLCRDHISIGRLKRGDIIGNSFFVTRLALVPVCRLVYLMTSYIFAEGREKGHDILKSLRFDASYMLQQIFNFLLVIYILYSSISYLVMASQSENPPISDSSMFTIQGC